MIVASVHMVGMLELLTWLERMDCERWHARDAFPHRENGVRAAIKSICWGKDLHGLLDKSDRERSSEIIAQGDAMEATTLGREALLG